jgi:signal transduction histidine kinase
MTIEPSHTHSQIQQAIIDLADPKRRREAARVLAAILGAENLIFFAVDEEIRVPLPVKGFPQTLPNGSAWQSFLASCDIGKTTTGELDFPKRGILSQATAITATDGTHMVLLGGQPQLDLIPIVDRQLPLLGAIFRAERAAKSSQANAEAAQQAVAQANTLTERLDQTRAALEHALVELSAATRSKDDFIAVVSHELRTPLNAVMGWISLMKSGLLDEPTRQQALESIERNARSQARMIDGVLDYSQVASGKLRISFEPVILAHVIREALDTARPVSEAKLVQIYAEILPDSVEVIGDPLRLQQMMWHLLSNAIKFTPPHGQVCINSYTQDDEVIVTIADTGEGISAQFLPHVFEQFKQADSTSSRPHGGMGLGLALTQRFVALHNGTIEIYSRGKGMGTSARLCLPISVPPPQTD